MATISEKIILVRDENAAFKAFEAVEQECFEHLVSEFGAEAVAQAQDEIADDLSLSDEEREVAYNDLDPAKLVRKSLKSWRIEISPWGESGEFSAYANIDEHWGRDGYSIHDQLRWLQDAGVDCRMIEI